MEEQRPIYGKRILLSFIIATIIFAGGFLSGYLISYSKYQSISISQEKIRYHLMDLDLQGKLITSSCNSPDFYSFSSELDSIGSIIGILEQRFGKKDNKVLEQKEIYSMLETQHFLLIKNYNEKCKKSIPTILFFYSNLEEFSGQSDKIGYILSSIKSQKKQIMIYSFDYDLDTSLIKLLKKNYNVTQPNTVIVNENLKLVQIKNIEDIQKYLK
ncbi:MAG: hypothetical protein AABX54_03050 [Nanoarchaeota archaeon]